MANDEITVLLTQDEMNALVDLCDNVGGPPLKSLRGTVDQIRQALHSSPGMVYTRNRFSGNLRFDNGHVD